MRIAFPYNGQQLRSVDMMLLCIGLIAILAVFYQFRQITEASSFWSVRVERLEKQQPGATTKSRRRSRTREFSQEIGKELQKANTILNQINLPWDTLFDAVEHIVTDDIALLTLQPDVQDQTLRISGESRNINALLDFVEAMEREVVFEQVHLVNYKIKQDNPYRPIDFLLTAVWTAKS